MSYVAKITHNGELSIGGGQCRIAKEVLETTLAEFNNRLSHQNVLGCLHTKECGETEHIGFSHKVTSMFSSNGEAFAVIEPIHTPYGEELNRMMKGCEELAENNDRYEFAPKGFMDHGSFNLTGIDIIKK